MPTQGAVVAPGASVAVGLNDGVPVRLALASRNAAGTGARSPLTPYLTPRPSVTWPFASPAEQVTAIFEAVDGRAPTAAELAGSLTWLQAGASPADVVEALLGLRGPQRLTGEQGSTWSVTADHH